MSQIEALSRRAIRQLPVGGGTAEMFLVTDCGKTTLMKRLRHELLSNPYYRALFNKEYQVGALLDCPYIVKYLDYSDTPADCHIMMEYVEGETLKERLASDSSYFQRNGNTERFLRQLLEGLRHIHSHHIVHLDLKPSNIMLTKVNGDVKILDLGFCYADSYLNSTGLSREYAAPEQLDGSKDIDARTDIYALGKILSLLPTAESLTPVISRCLATDKDKRWQSADEIIGYLDRKRHRKLFLGITALFIAILCAAGTLAHYYHIDDDMIASVETRIANIPDFEYHCIKYKILSHDSLTCEAIGSNAEAYWQEYGQVDLNIKAIVEDQHATKYRVVGVRNDAFLDSLGIRSVSIHDGIQYLGDEAFYRCSDLVSVNIPESVTEIGESCFARCKKLSVMRLPSGIKEIKRATFHDTALRSIVIPEGVTVIRQDAFVDCPQLKEVTLPSTLHTIERGVFYRCRKIEEITIPASVREIGVYTFMDCTSLRRIYNYAEEPQRCVSLFNSDTQITVYVPAASVERYKAAECWRDCIIRPL